MKKGGFGAFEMTISVLIILALIYIFIPKYKEVINDSKFVIREKEIKEFQSIITYYHFENKKLPTSLRELIDKGYIEFKEEFTKERISGDDILDPFGNPYLYDGKTGKISYLE